MQYLRRPPEENEDFRLDRLLHRKAVEGVKIYIVVYKEMSLALTIDSVHTKQWLQNLHPNIIVQRHPDHTFSNDNTVLFWSHHEVMCSLVWPYVAGTHLVAAIENCGGR